MSKGLCIVGSGVGGSSLALKLAEYGYKVTIIEAGNDKRDSNAVTYESVGRKFGLRATTSIEIGGTSNLWHGVLSMLDPIDFKKREYINNSGWPIDIEELLPFYKEAGNIYNLKDYERVFTKTSKKIKHELTKIKFNASVFENKIFQQPLPVKRFKELIKNEPNINIIKDSVALELFIDEPAGNVTSIKIGNPDGTTSIKKYDLFILSLGALETPRLLLNSKNFHNINIGRYLMDHPMGNLFQVKFKTPKKAPIYSDMKYSKKHKVKTGLIFAKEFQEINKLPNHCFYIRPSFIPGIDDESEKVKLALLTFLSGKLTFADVIKLVKNWNAVLQILVYKLSFNVRYKYADLFFVTEQIPNRESKVTLSEKLDHFGYPIARVNWQVKNEEINIVEKCYRIIRANLSTRDFIYMQTEKDLKWKDRLTSAAHHVGTCRMATSKADGVVDSNLMVFGTNNLFVCDGSVFPTSGNVNSAFTISALACRLANHIKDLI